MIGKQTRIVSSGQWDIDSSSVFVMIFITVGWKMYVFTIVLMLIINPIIIIIIIIKGKVGLLSKYNKTRSLDNH